MSAIPTIALVAPPDPAYSGSADVNYGGTRRTYSDWTVGYMLSEYVHKAVTSLVSRIRSSKGVGYFAYYTGEVATLSPVELKSSGVEVGWDHDGLGGTWHIDLDDKRRVHINVTITNKGLNAGEIEILDRLRAQNSSAVFSTRSQGNVPFLTALLIRDTTTIDANRVLGLRAMPVVAFNTELPVTMMAGKLAGTVKDATGMTHSLAIPNCLADITIGTSVPLRK